MVDQVTFGEQTFLGGVAENERENYQERIRYLDFILQKKQELGIKFLDTINEKSFYGFIDKEYYFVEQNAELRAFGDYAGEIVGLNYLVDCFNQFRDFYLKFIQESTETLPPQLDDLVVKRSYISLPERYERYQRVVSQALIDPFISGRFSGADLSFEEFVEKLDEVIFDDDKKQYKITKAGYILSRYVTAFETGLYIDFNPDLNPSIDFLKVELVSHPGFKCYGQIANQYGFLVDQNCPWRLVLDLKSERVQKNITNSVDSRPFWHFYSEEYLMRLGLDDYWNLKSFYKKLYIKYSQFRDIENPASRFDQVPEERWIRSYITNRFKELGVYKKSDFFSSDDDPTDGKKFFQKNLTEAEEKYRILKAQQLQPLSHNSGVLGFIEKVCSNLLRERLVAMGQDEER